MSKYLDEEKFVEGFEDAMGRALNRVLKAGPDDLKEATEIYLKFVDAYDKSLKTQNNYLLEDSKNALDCEKLDREMKLKAESAEREMELKFAEFEANRRKARRDYILGVAKVVTSCLGLGAAFAYEFKDNIFTSQSSRGVVSGLFRKPADDLR